MNFMVKPNRRPITGRWRYGGLISGFCRFFIFANILFSAMSLFGREDDPDEADGPGYEISLNARDPFFPSPVRISQEESAADGSADIEKMLSLTLVSSSATGSFAILNQRLVRAGEDIRLTLDGRQVSLTILDIDSSLPGVRVGYQNREILILSNPDSGD